MAMDYGDTNAAQNWGNYRGRDWRVWESTGENRSALAAALLQDRFGRASPMLQEFMQKRLMDAMSAYTALGYRQTAQGRPAEERERLGSYFTNVMSGAKTPEQTARDAFAYLGGGGGSDDYSRAWREHLENVEDPYTALRLTSMIKGWTPDFTGEVMRGAPQQRTTWRGLPEPAYGQPSTPYLSWLMQRYAAK